MNVNVIHFSTDSFVHLLKYFFNMQVFEKELIIYL